MAFVQDLCQLSQPSKSIDTGWSREMRLDVSVLKIDLYVDDKLIVPSDVDLQIVEDHPLATIEGTEGTVLALGACWHGE